MQDPGKLLAAIDGVKEIQVKKILALGRGYDMRRHVCKTEEYIYVLVFLLRRYM